MHIAIPRNTKIPATFSLARTTAVDNQTSMRFKIYEGEQKMAKDNNFLGKFVSSGITPALCAVEKIDLTFDLDVDGILHVTARDQRSGRRNDIKITNIKGRLTQNEIERMKLELKTQKKTDKNKEEKIGMKNRMEKYILSMKEKIFDNNFEIINFEKKIEIINICNETELWLKKNQNGKKHEYEKELKKIQDVYWAY